MQLQSSTPTPTSSRPSPTESRPGPRPAPAAKANPAPGLTSLIKTGRGLMTLQTEIVGDPAQVVTIVDFRGRVLKTWQRPLEADGAELSALVIAQRWHAQMEAQVRANLTRAAQRQPGNEAVSHLFLAATQAYAERDFETARAVLVACELLLPDDKRIQAALTRVQTMLRPRGHGRYSH